MKAIFKSDLPKFDQMLAKFMAASGMSLMEAIKYQGMLYGKELMDRTPPFSGKSIIRMLGGRNDGAVLKDVEVEGMNARQVGIRRVQKDIGRVIYGYKQVPKAANPDVKRQAQKTIGGFPMQKCQGKVAIRIFATKKGEVYGTDQANFLPKATQADLEKFHTFARTKRGRVSTAGTRTVNVGRWRWLNVVVTRDATVRAYVRKKQGSVGEGKAGWGAGFIRCGGKLGLTGWIGRHVARSSDVQSNIGAYNGVSQARPYVTFINKSRWASSGDFMRIIPMAQVGRLKAMQGDIDRRIKDEWQKARKANK